MKKVIKSVNSNAQVNLVELQKKFGKVDSLTGIPNNVGHSGEGPQQGTVVPHLPVWAQEMGLNASPVLNRYKTIEFIDDMGFKQTKHNVFNGFYIFTKVGTDNHGRSMIDSLHFYDEKYSGENGTTAMSFEAAIANIMEANQNGVEPVGPARKLWAICLENGINNPLHLVSSDTVDTTSGEVSYPTIQYAKKQKKYNSMYGKGFYTRRTVMSLALWKSYSNNKPATKGESKPRLSANNYYANANKAAFERAFGK